MSVRGAAVRLGVVLAVGVLAVTLVAGRAGAQAGERIRAFDVSIEVSPDGTMQVVEAITYDFGPNSRRGIYRILPVRYDLPAAVTFDLPEGATPADLVRALDLDAIRVSSDSAPDDVQIEGPGLHASGGATTSIRIGDEDVFITGVHTYTISYRVDGALNGFGGDPPELSWDATGDGWTVPMDEVTVRVVGPGVREPRCFRGSYGATDVCGAAAIGDGAARFSADGLAPGEGVTVVVGFDPAGVSVPPPLLHHRWTLARALTGSAWAWPLTVLTAVLGIGGVLLLAYREGRDRLATGDVTVDGRVASTAPGRRRRVGERPPVPVRFRPPEALPPALLGLIVDERVDAVDISATVVDLARRGHLRITEQETKVLWIRRSDWRLTRTPEEVAADDPELRPYERQLLAGLFEDGDEVDVSDLTGSFADEYRRVQRSIYEEGRLRRWFARRPDQARGTWTALGVGALIGAVGLTVVALLFTTVALAALPLVVAALLLLLLAPRMPRRTSRGSALLTETLGFKEFIVTAETDRMDFAEAEQMFVAYLPYAVVFGAVDRWAERFAELGVATGAAVGGWYVGSRGFDAQRFSSGLSDFSSAVGSSLSTSPSSGGSSGGFSGGGMGGGGGGSW